MSDTTITLIFLVVVFAIVRSIMLWYWKVDEQVALLKSIREELRGLREFQMMSGGPGAVDPRAVARRLDAASATGSTAEPAAQGTLADEVADEWVGSVTPVRPTRWLLHRSPTRVLESPDSNAREIAQLHTADDVAVDGPSGARFYRVTTPDGHTGYVHELDLR